MEQPEIQTIVFFDGYCGLCSHSVDFLIERDRDRKLVYSPLQGETARALLNEKQRNDLESVVVVTRDPIRGITAQFSKSDALLFASGKLGPGWSALTGILRVFPRPLRDMVYDLIARNRFKFFGKRESCRLPTTEERKLFLP